MQNRRKAPEKLALLRNEGRFAGKISPGNSVQIWQYKTYDLRKPPTRRFDLVESVSSITTSFSPPLRMRCLA